MEYTTITQLLGTIVLLIGMIGMFAAGYGYGYEKAREEDSTVDK